MAWLTPWRACLLRLHRWAGLALAGFLLLTGITGTLIAWTQELDAWLNPQLFRTPGTPAAGAAQMLALAERLEAAHPHIRINVLPLALPAGEAALLHVQRRAGTQQSADASNLALGYDQVFAHPVSGHWLGQRQWGKAALSSQHWLPFIYKLHYSLHLPGIWGAWLLGGVALLWALDCLWALALAFPSRKAWRKSFAFRWGAGGHKLTFDLHRSGGVWLWPLLLALAVTGVGLNLRDEVLRPVTAWFSPLAPQPWQGRKGLPGTAPGISRVQAVQAAVQAARTQGWAVQALAPSEAAATAQAGPSTLRPWRWVDWSHSRGLHGVAFTRPGQDPYGRGIAPHWVYVDAATGVVTDMRAPLQGSAGDIFMRAQYSLHSGRVLGLPGRVLVTLLGLGVSAISITGVMIWLRKRRSRKTRR